MNLPQERLPPREFLTASTVEDLQEQLKRLATVVSRLPQNGERFGYDVIAKAVEGVYANEQTFIHAAMTAYKVLGRDVTQAPAAHVRNRRSYYRYWLNGTPIPEYGYDIFKKYCFDAAGHARLRDISEKSPKTYAERQPVNKRPPTPDKEDELRRRDARHNVEDMNNYIAAGGTRKEYFELIKPQIT